MDIDQDHEGPWVSGWVQCTSCDREWVAVRPQKCNVLECPDCHRMSGFKRLEQPEQQVTKN